MWASVVEEKTKTRKNKPKKHGKMAETKNRCHSEPGGTPGEEPAFRITCHSCFLRGRKKSRLGKQKTRKTRRWLLALRGSAKKPHRFVTLSEVNASRSEAFTQSKDPYPLCSSIGPAGRSYPRTHRALAPSHSC